MPLLYAFVLLVVGVAVSVLVTRAVMQPRINEATASAEEAQGQVETLTKRLENTIREASETEASLRAELEKTSKKSSKDKDGGSSGAVKSSWVSSGSWSSGDETLDGEVKAFCDARTDSSMSQDVAALEVYKGVAWSDYVERDNAQHPSGKNWRIEYARQYYENDSTGNCYEFAAFLSYCLQYLGYGDAHAEGVGIQLQSGELGDHGIVFVTNTDGSACLCDTARGTDGWMLPVDTYNMEIWDFES